MMKKYQNGGMASSDRPKMRPKARPDDLMEGRSSAAPARPIRPRKRPQEIEDMMSSDTAVGRGNRASMREAMEMPEGMMAGGKVGMHKMPDGTMMKDSAHKMKAGGKVRGAGMASKGVRACKMM
jgi:hypothetical protein